MLFFLISASVVIKKEKKKFFSSEIVLLLLFICLFTFPKQFSYRSSAAIGALHFNWLSYRTEIAVGRDIICLVV